MLRCVVGVLIGVVFGWSPADAKQLPFPEAVAPCGISLWSNPQADTSGVWSLVVAVGCQECEPSAVGLVRVAVEEGAQVVSGDTVRRVHPRLRSSPRDSQWQLVLRKVGPAPVSIRATLRVPESGDSSFAYFEQTLKLGFQGTQNSVLENRTVVQIAVKNGQTIRYGGPYQVMVDPDDIQSPSSFDSHPELIEGGAIQCKACGLRDTVKVEVVFTVRRDGTVTWIRPTEMTGAVSGQIWNAVQDGLHHYRFRPAYSEGRPVADFSILQVRVVPAN